MEKSIDEKLFFRMLQFQRVMRRNIINSHKGPKGKFGHQGEDCMMGKHGCRPEECMPGKHGIQSVECMTRKHGHHGAECMPGRPSHHEHGGMHFGHGHEKMRAFAQARLLTMLLQYEKGVRQKVLAESMNINPSSTSELISKLEQEGYVIRTVDPDDKRATLISLTEVGRARAYELEDERAEKFSNVFRNLDDKEKEKLLELLEKVMEVESDIEGIDR